jgi:hypothetical protein
MPPIQPEQVTIFGIRHHGPGSARSLQQALELLQPDCMLVEGPPDAGEVLPLLTHEEMKPPVALLVYVPDEPHRAVYYPFAQFSPEWQAIRHGLSRGIPVRFMDLPQWHCLAVAEGGGPEEPAAPDAAAPEGPPGACARDGEAAPDELSSLEEIRRDPLRWLAEAAGYSDGERWWEHMVEHRQDGGHLFQGVLEAMTALRQAEAGAPSETARQVDAAPEALREEQREAYMRQTIRAAQREGFERIAVVCGAWHAPALTAMPAAGRDAETLKGLPKVRTAATWVPWTHGRLCLESGYGAGIESPGWYQHLWTSGQASLSPTRVAIGWITQVARLLRSEDLDASSAHVIEAVRLAEVLAALRQRPLPGLPELNEATRTVLCFGDELPMQLIRQRLIVGETLGEVPDETPMVPLQQDLLREQRRLRLPPEAMQKRLDLDLRKPNELDRSHLLHRLSLLGIPWGDREQVSGKSGTFHEVWRLQWKPEFAVEVIEAALWGNTVYDAATAAARDAADRAPNLPALTGLVDRALLADLPDASARLIERLEAEAALASDVAHLMDALPALASVLRYGNVRKTDAGMVAHVVDGLVTRISVGLPTACASLNDEAAGQMFDRIVAVNGAVALLQDEGHTASWQGTLRHLSGQEGIHGLVSGRCCRILMDQGVFSTGEAARRMNLALSTATDPPQAAAWVEGFLGGSGELLLHDEALWQVLDMWVAGLRPGAFEALLPLLRRTFSSFPPALRRRMGERVRRGPPAPGGARAWAGEGDGFDTERAEAVLPLVARLLGIGASR